jgi:hypothetical protein
VAEREKGERRRTVRWNDPAQSTTGKFYAHAVGACLVFKAR